MRDFLQHLRSARTTDRLFTLFGKVHITKLHIYGVTAGGLTMLDIHDGHHLYGILVFVLAALDMVDD